MIKNVNAETNMAANQQKASVRDNKSHGSAASLSSTAMLGNVSSGPSLTVGSRPVILSNEGLSLHQTARRSEVLCRYRIIF